MSVKELEKQLKAGESASKRELEDMIRKRIFHTEEGLYGKYADGEADARYSELDALDLPRLESYLETLEMKAQDMGAGSIDLSTDDEGDWLLEGESDPSPYLDDGRERDSDGKPYLAARFAESLECEYCEEDLFEGPCECQRYNGSGFHLRGLNSELIEVKPIEANPIFVVTLPHYAFTENLQKRHLNKIRKQLESAMGQKVTLIAKPDDIEVESVRVSDIPGLAEDVSLIKGQIKRMAEFGPIIGASTPPLWDLPRDHPDVELYAPQAYKPKKKPKGLQGKTAIKKNKSDW